MRKRNDRGLPKQAANVSIRSDLLKAAREAGVNLSATLERALIIELKQHQTKQWLDENREAIAAYNAHVEANGVFSDEHRSF